MTNTLCKSSRLASLRPFLVIGSGLRERKRSRKSCQILIGTANGRGRPDALGTDETQAAAAIQNLLLQK